MISTNWTIGKRLWFLSISLILLICIIGIIPFKLNIFYNEKLSRFSNVILPSIKNLTLADMYHDGIRANLLASIMILENKQYEKLDELNKEQKEMTTAFQEHISIFEKISLNKEIDDSTKEVLSDVKKYIEISTQLNAYARDKKLYEIKAGQPAFHEVFKKLEGSLEKLTTEVEKYSHDQLEESSNFSKNAILITTLILILALVLGITLSIYIIKKLNSNLNKLIVNLVNQAQQINHTATNLQSTSADLSEMTTKQAAAIAETAASMEEMSSMLAQTSKHSSHNMTIVEEGQSGAQRGKEAINQMLLAMDSIQASNIKLEAISTLITKIANKTKIINEIVSETRLLSFNASIEAARAGIHGKGFAVVAEEVGKLATISGTSANEIRELLESSTIEVAHVVGDIRERTVAGKNIFKECELTFDNMTDILAKITEATKAIVSSTREQELGVKQITIAMHQMDQVTQRNSSISDTQANDAKLLTHRLKSVEDLISHFKALIMGQNQSNENQFSSNDFQNMQLMQDSKHIKKDDSQPPEYEKESTHNYKDQPVQISSDKQIKRSDSRWKAN